MFTYTTSKLHKPEAFEALRANYPAGTVFLIQVGDWWEAFGQDADALARSYAQAHLIGAGTTRMAGVSAADRDAAIYALVGAGHKVVLLERA